MTSIGGFDLQRVQRLRKIAVAAGLIVLLLLSLFTATRWGDGAFHESLEAIGLGAIILCIVGRAWCSLYIGGRKKAEIVDRGPYSISRNPLYVFSYIGAFGAGAQTGSIILALIFTALTAVVFHFTMKREETWLAAEFGKDYADYVARTPRLVPNLSGWRDKGVLTVRPEFFLRTIRDGLVFLLAVPLFEGFEKLQEIGWLTPLVHLP